MTLTKDDDDSDILFIKIYLNEEFVSFCFLKYFLYLLIAICKLMRLFIIVREMYTYLNSVWVFKDN